MTEQHTEENGNAPVASEDASAPPSALYLGNIPADFSVDDMKQLFPDMLRSSKIWRRQNRGHYAIVDFETPEKAKQELEKSGPTQNVRGTEITIDFKAKSDNPRGRRGVKGVRYNARRKKEAAANGENGTVVANGKSSRKRKGKKQSSDGTVAVAPDPCEVYIAPLSNDTSIEDLQNALSSFGTITSSQIGKRRIVRSVKSNEESKSETSQLNYGFVKFESPEQAEKAIAASGTIQINGTPEAPKIENRKQARTKTSGSAKSSSSSAKSIFGIHIPDVPFDTLEDQIKETFSQFGEILNAGIRTVEPNALLEFEDEDSREQAYTALQSNPPVLNGTTLRAFKTGSSKKSSADDENQDEKEDENQGPDLFKLVLSDFNAESQPSESDIEQILKDTISSFKALTVRPRKQYAFVHYKEPEAVENAIQASPVSLANQDEVKLSVEKRKNHRGKQRRRNRFRPDRRSRRRQEEDGGNDEE